MRKKADLIFDAEVEVGQARVWQHGPVACHPDLAASRHTRLRRRPFPSVAGRPARRSRLLPPDFRRSGKRCAASSCQPLNNSLSAGGRRYLRFDPRTSREDRSFGTGEGSLVAGRRNHRHRHSLTVVI
jgi:hypothetical protein